MVITGCAKRETFLGWVGLACAALASLAGCASPWSSMPRIAPSGLRGGPVSLAGYYPDETGWRWTYRRTREPDKAFEYARHIDKGSYAEGNLIGRTFDPLDSYVEQRRKHGLDNATKGAGKQTNKPRRRWKRAPLRGEYGVIMTFEEPLPPLPLELKPGEAQTFRTKLRCYSESGKHYYDGSVTRNVLLVGRGSLTVGDERYDKVLRLRMTTRFYFHWTSVLDIDQTVWLAPDVGVVRRVDKIVGWILLLPYSSTERMDLVAFDRPASYRTPTPESFAGFKRCRVMAAEVGAVFPRPRLAGLYMELAGPPSDEPYTKMAMRSAGGTEERTR